MKFRVIFSPEAEEQLADLYRYIASAASPGIAERYVNAIITYCETLETSPLRGAQRDDIRPGLRITNYKGRTVIAFDADARQVSIIGVFYGGQDYETALQDDLEDKD
ncbi:type II toxin-antitoxin system RelE/ParE family toxin [Sulfuritalea hydrogenivorans]|jgi:plasmid stabilization system protein ParE|uniref:Plasmid stabilization system protein n=1 Tax=Sulfuritalea hydrogenivorans sk43H TaxID=1223802 RepID=W0SIH9_9PROT|nr:type II toxin-antitoxin system RelE/ParE family toxin [Sulfuritalea hydrogenivorans]MDK9715477.1 type II toxin-antitoxin system RelE/ParE family toxin [Sulfuritalea sp.]BAO30296.1 plasmid stabilization system protein [Sulfuritalea hydrogenivorans sk43H]